MTALDTRTSHAEREETAERLGTAYAEGRLGRDELDHRVGLALAARTRADLAALLADLPSPESTGTPHEPSLAAAVWAAVRSCLCCH